MFKKMKINKDNFKMLINVHSDKMGIVKKKKKMKEIQD